MRTGDTGHPAQIKQVAAASVIGTVVEWYDFFLYGTMAALVFNKEFFPEVSPLLGTMIAFATFAAGFVTRPLGGILFGHFGDKLGRKKMLVITMMIMGGATFLMGALPTYHQIGMWAPILLLVLRMLQGIGLGGEWGGAALMAVEHAPANRRGWYSSWPQLGVPIGLLLSTGAVTGLGVFGDDALVAWAWRVPFLLSFVLIAVGLFIRLRVAETPGFEALREANAQVSVPLVEVVRKHPKVTLLGMGARLSESVTFNVYNAFLLTYTTVVLGLSKSVALNGLLIAAVIGMVVIPFAGGLSDRYGRRIVFGAGAALAAVSAFPIFWALDSKSTVLIWVAVIVGWALAACTMYGPEAAFFAELYPTRVRYSGMSLIYQIGVLPSGAIAPLVATSLVKKFDGASWPVALYVLVIAVISVISVLLAPETNKRQVHPAGEEVGDETTVSRNPAPTAETI
ncbi:MFS transporter [Actinopolymorpha rutila]|uniref:Putative proline/betaine transporter n=1 Tax=Actinopolymorpha rutila TaxID=446787 RepID=A0A852ZP56_9ACTN|nr:metabolite-proton symporter [Actinopolymorpha rutila]